MTVSAAPPIAAPSAPAPRVSLVVPAFNEPPEILAQSIASITAQSFVDFECLLIDESTDPASIRAAVALCDADPRLRRIVPPQRIGLAASLNLGIDHARGDYLARFDADDVCYPERLALQVTYLDAHREVDVLGAGLELITPSGETVAFRAYPLQHAAIARRMHLTTAIAHPTVMARRSAIVSAGGYDPSFRFAEDLDLWLRLLNRGTRFANLDQPLVRYRQDVTRRRPDHWRYNLIARRRNFASSHAFRRIMGIGALSIWTHTPPGLQEMIFRTLILRAGTQERQAS